MWVSFSPLLPNPSHVSLVVLWLMSNHLEKLDAWTQGVQGGTGQGVVGACV